jgi:hypothetical protein
MEIQFQAGEHVKVAGFNRPCIVMGSRTHDRTFKGRKDQVGDKKQLDELHYIVQIVGSSSTRMYPQSKLKRIPAAELELELAAADPLPNGVNQSISGNAQRAANERQRAQARAEEKARLLAEIAEREEQAELDGLRKKAAALRGDESAQ